MVSLALCIILEKMCIAGGLYFEIWKIDESVERLEGHDESIDLGGLFKQLNTPISRTELNAATTPGNVKFHAS